MAIGNAKTLSIVWKVVAWAIVCRDLEWSFIFRSVCAINKFYIWFICVIINNIYSGRSINAKISYEYLNSK